MIFCLEAQVLIGFSFTTPSGRTIFKHTIVDFRPEQGDRI